MSRRRGASESVGPPSGIITLLTDFGLSDPFVGVMKGIIATVNRAATVIDLTHDIPPQDVMRAALVLERSFRYFPPGTVHLAVVDPGVGTDRKPIAIASEGHVFVGPDNGVLSLAAPRGEAVELDLPDFFLSRISNTFHGRDLFAPVAAHLASGRIVTEIGHPLPTYARLHWPTPRSRAGRTRGEVVLVDHFGNLVTNLNPTHIAAPRPRRSIGQSRPQHPSAPLIQIGDATLHGVHTAYGEVPPGALVAVLGGFGLLEIAIRNGSAQAHLGLGTGTAVLVTH